MKPTLPPLLAASERLLREVEDVVPTFPKKTRYLLGQDIRGEAIQGLLHAQSALRQRAPGRQIVVLQALSDSNDRIKAFLQVAHRLQSFRSAGQFEVVAKVARDVGRQTGALLNAVKQKHLQGQSPAACAPAGASPDTECPLRPTGAQR